MAQPTKPGNADRGWNDPPMFLHCAQLDGQSVQPPKKRPGLTKRVAHPGISGPTQPAGATTSEDRSPLMVIPPLLPSSGSVAPPVGTVVLFPPAATTALPGPAPVIVPNMAPLTHTTSTHSPTEAQQTGDIEVPDFADDRQMFNYIVSRLQRVLKDCQPLLLPRVTEEISRKLGVFETMWENGKISYPVKAAMAKLSIALCKRKCDVAHEIHMALMMDYVSEVSQWMVGVKRLIQEARTVSPPNSPGGSPQGAAPVIGSPQGAAPVVGSPQEAAPVVGSPQGAAPVVGSPQGAAPVVGSPQGAAPVVGSPQEAAPVTVPTLPGAAQTNEQPQDIVEHQAEIDSEANKCDIVTQDESGEQEGDKLSLGENSTDIT